MKLAPFRPLLPTAIQSLPGSSPAIQAHKLKEPAGTFLQTNQEDEQANDDERDANTDCETEPRRWISAKHSLSCKREPRLFEEEENQQKKQRKQTSIRARVKIPQDSKCNIRVIKQRKKWRRHVIERLHFAKKCTKCKAFLLTPLLWWRNGCQ